MKPFDLEAFKAGQEAITRAGRRAKFVGYCEEAEDYPLAVCICGDKFIQGYTKEGLFYKNEESDVDLISMAPTKREAWVNIYGDGERCYKFPTKEQADRAADDDRIACVRIEWEE